jgi:glucose/arabinose dehydrogenase
LIRDSDAPPSHLEDGKYFSTVMKCQSSILFLALWTLLAQRALAVNCPNLQPSSTPVASDGWSAQLIAQDLSKPRGIILDSDGGLLVVQQGAGIARLAFADGGSSCLELTNKTLLINSTLVSAFTSLYRSLLTNSQLNHGIALSNDGKTLYASSADSVFSWAYDAKTVTVSDTNQTLITGMSNDDHTTRTLLMSMKEPGTLVVSRGSMSNIDIEAESLSSGHSQIKAFDVNNMTSTSEPYDFTTSGRLLGWGLRNSVGVAEEPLTGGIWSVENSADQVSIFSFINYNSAVPDGIEWGFFKSH